MTESAPLTEPKGGEPESRVHKQKASSTKLVGSQKKNQPLRDSARNQQIKSPSNIDELIQIALSMGKTNAEDKLSLEDLPLDQKTTGREILELLSMTDFVISDKFKLDSISAQNLDEILTKTQNLSVALTSFSSNRNQKALRIIKSKSLASLNDFEKFTKLSTKNYLVPRQMLNFIVDEIIDSSIYKKSQIIIQLEVISYVANQRIDPTKLIKALGNITSDFNNQDEKFQNRIIESLRRFNICSVYQLLMHIDSEKIRVALCNQLIQDLSVNEIVAFFAWISPEPNLSKVGVYKRIIVPSVENFIKWGNSLEDLLYLWPHLTNPEHGFNLSELKVKFKHLIGKSGYLAESLRDSAVPVLQSENQLFRENLQIAEKIAAELSQELTQLTIVNQEIKFDLDAARVSRLENSREANAAQAAIVRQIRIDTLRGLVPALERALASDEQNEILRILEEQRIEMVGRVGQKIRWNSQICESLTGEEISEGLVVKTGFTWFDGKEIVPLRRMLLKSE
jgi:uncharacterized protein YbcI